MPTRNVVLTDHQAVLIERLVSSGRYQNASEVLRDGIRLLERREAEAEARLQALRQAVRIGIADMEAGRFTVFDSSESIEEHFAALTEEVLAEAVPKASSGR
jgi:antitoxin ParD1/3/4